MLEEKHAKGKVHRAKCNRRTNCLNFEYFSSFRNLIEAAVECLQKSENITWTSSARPSRETTRKRKQQKMLDGLG
jgi:hypothetical protein